MKEGRGEETNRQLTCTRVEEATTRGKHPSELTGVVIHCVHHTVAKLGHGVRHVPVLVLLRLVVVLVDLMRGCAWCLESQKSQIDDTRGRLNRWTGRIK